MKTLYIECKMGVAGDMLSASLLELCDNKDQLMDRLNNMGIPGVTYSLEKSSKCDIVGSHLTVLVNGEEEESLDVHEHDHSHKHEHKEVPLSPDSPEHVHTSLEETSASAHSHEHDHSHEHSHEHEHHHHAHRHLSDIEHIVSHLNIDEAVKADIINVYRLIAEAESKVHGSTVSEIHFHEVGNMDAVADIAAACLVMRNLSPDKVVVSPIHVGSGQVKCAHGILPVPAPATALLLSGIPSYSGDIRGELCTPTGAALIKYFATGFGAQPVMSVEKIGYGMGKKDFPQANCVRAMIGEAMDFSSNSEAHSGNEFNSSNGTYSCNESPLSTKNQSSDEIFDESTDTIAELVCNLDDMTPEEIGFATERLMEKGALDVFTTPIGMKKNRPGTMLTVLCRETDKAGIIKNIFKFTTTIGIRENICKRYILSRTEKVESTPDGVVRIKQVSGYGVKREKTEYEDRAKIAREKGTGLR